MAANHKWRISWSVFYFGIGLVILIAFWCKMVYFPAEKDSLNLYRFLWCIGWSFIGFSAIAWYWRSEKKTPNPEYCTYYPLLLLIISLLGFLVGHSYEKIPGFFYYASTAFCLIFSFTVDQFWDYVKAAISRFAPKPKTEKPT